MCVMFHIVLPLFSFLIVYLAFSVLSHICGCLSHHPFVILSVSLLSPFLFITPSVYSPIFVLHTPTNMHTCAHTDTHTFVSLGIFFPLFHPTLLYLHALSLSKVTTFVFMSYPLCVGVCVQVCVRHTVTHSCTHRHTQTLIHAPWTLCSTISLLNSLPPHLYSSPPPPHLVLRLSLLHLTHF